MDNSYIVNENQVESNETEIDQEVEEELLKIEKLSSDLRAGMMVASCGNFG